MLSDSGRKRFGIWLSVVAPFMTLAPFLLAFGMLRAAGATLSDALLGSLIVVPAVAGFLVALLGTLLVARLCGFRRKLCHQLVKQAMFLGIPRTDRIARRATRRLRWQPARTVPGKFGAQASKLLPLLDQASPVPLSYPQVVNGVSQNTTHSSRASRVLVNVPREQAGTGVPLPPPAWVARAPEIASLC